MTSAAAGNEPSAPSSRRALLGAVVLSIIVGNFIPFGSIVLYPFTLMATWAHEMGHGLAAIAVGGVFERLEIHADASGLAYSQYEPGARAGVVAIAGLLAPPLLGAITLAVSRGPKRGRFVLAALCVAMMLSCALWIRTVVGWVAIPLVALALGACAVWGSPRERMIAAQFVGLRLAVDTVTRIDYVFAREAIVDGVAQPSDVALITASWGAVVPLWSLVVATVSLALVGVGLWAAWRAPGRPEQPARRSDSA